MAIVRRAFVAFALSLTISLAAISGFALADRTGTSSDPMAQMKGLADQLLAESRAPECQSGQKICRDKMRALVEAHWDVLEMARNALGVHWKSLDDNERHRFAKLFGNLTEAIYLSRANLSKAEGVSRDAKIEFVREIFDGNDYCQVNSYITLQGHDKPISVNYRLKRDGDVWKAYDVVVEGISVVANYRNQFNRVINSKGYPALVRELQERVQRVQASGEGA
ncbi:MAG TPA: ABC transporter substrate-binding protein [Candidatus Binataceae bacterium]|nr:ABC transporter substrate-binding protein [Candidatus Binataceae bacterium]